MSRRHCLLIFAIFCGGASSGSVSGDPPREFPGLHNVHQASAQVLLGSEPQGAEAFAALREQGIRTIVSVDGARPDVATAGRYGLRYVHIPIGYDGIPESSRQQLTQVAWTIDGPVYVHCHHGRHRGPAAAAVVCLAAGSLNAEQATALMTRAGTGKDYAGLWRDVRHFVPPPADAELPALVEVAEVASLAAAMAGLDRSFDHLKLCATAGWKAPDEHPDLVPVTEALLVREGLAESLRHVKKEASESLDAADPGASEEFRTWLADSVKEAEQLEEAVRRSDAVLADQLLKQLDRSCRQCHEKYRNQ
jgi:protein tyrosine phosphatase (PTP) superfamily phosphohydrolase (DUF442 family)